MPDVVRRDSASLEPGWACRSHAQAATRRGRHRRRALLLGGALLASAAAVAGLPTFDGEVPAGWSRQGERDVEVLRPPGAEAAHVALMLLPTQPLEANLSGQFDRWRQTLGARLSVSDVREVAPPRQGRDASGPYMLWSVSVAQADPAAGRLWVTAMVRGVDALFVDAIFVADSPERVRAWLPAAAQAFQALHVTPAGARPATTTTTTLAPAADAAAPSAIPSGVGTASLQSLVGVWAGNTTQRVSSLGTFGGGALTLKIAPDGRYDYLHESNDAGCSITRTSTGVLSMAGGLLVMQPATDHEHRVRHKADALCASGDADLPLRPRRFKVDVESTDQRGQASYALSIWSDSEPSQSLRRVAPRPQAASMPRPPGLPAPTTPVPAWMAGAWRAVGAPAPEWRLDARASLTGYRADLEFLAGGRYHLRVHRPDVLDSPACTKNLDLDEDGTALHTLAAPNLAHARLGSLALIPEHAKLTEQVQRCGADDRTTSQELAHAPRYLSLRQLDNRTDRLELGCNLAYSAGRSDYPLGSYLACPETADILSDGYVRP